jgi:hypothetical protein
MRRITISLLLAVAVGVSACGDALEGVGDLSRRIVHGDETSTTTTLGDGGGAALDLAGVTEAFWVNDGFDAGVDVLSPESLIAAIWRRGEQDSAFVQASREEIVAVLPGIEFPRLIPADVLWISSQLVYDLQTATLDPATSAAFGFWTVQPYTAPRAEAQLAVLRVGAAPEGDEEGEIFSFRVSEGRELTWNDGGHAYQLFCRTGVTERACFEMARSTTLLRLLRSLGSLDEG